MYYCSKCKFEYHLSAAAEMCCEEKKEKRCIGGKMATRRFSVSFEILTEDSDESSSDDRAISIIENRVVDLVALVNNDLSRKFTSEVWLGTNSMKIGLKK